MPKNMKPFYEMLGCVYPVSLITLDSHGKVLNSYDSNQTHIDFFQRNRSRKELLKIAKTETMPIILTGAQQMIWSAVSERRNNRLSRLHIIGPVFTERKSDKELYSEIEKLNYPTNFQSGAFKHLRTIPYVPYRELCDATKMLHFYVQEKKIDVTDFILQNKSTTLTQTPKEENIDYKYFWELEHAMISQIENGQPEYLSIYSRMIKSDYRMYQIFPEELHQERYQSLTLTNLCIRALISAGASAESAFFTGEFYLQAMAQAETISELRELTKNMIQTFVSSGFNLKYNPKLSKSISSCCEYIMSHLSEPLDVKRLAEHFHYSPAYLERKFKSEMNSSISKYIMLMRLEQAKHLLSATDQPIQDIASNLYFCSSSHFSTKFKQYTGFLPSEYRGKHQS